MDAPPFSGDLSVDWRLVISAPQAGVNSRGEYSSPCALSRCWALLCDPIEVELRNPAVALKDRATSLILSQAVFQVGIKPVKLVSALRACGQIT